MDEGFGFVTGDVFQKGVYARAAGVLGLGGMPPDGAPRLDHAEAGVADDLLVVGPHELAEELDGLGDGVAEHLEPGLPEEVPEPLGLGADLGAEFAAGSVQLQTDVLPPVAFGAKFSDEFEQVLGVRIGRRGECARGNHREALRNGDRERAKRTTGGVTCL